MNATVTRTARQLAAAKTSVANIERSLAEGRPEAAAIYAESLAGQVARIIRGADEAVAEDADFAGWARVVRAEASALIGR
jgi:hypothetical protein